MADIVIPLHLDLLINMKIISVILIVLAICVPVQAEPDLQRALDQVKAQFAKTSKYKHNSNTAEIKIPETTDIIRALELALEYMAPFNRENINRRELSPSEQLKLQEEMIHKKQEDAAFIENVLKGLKVKHKTIPDNDTRKQNK